MSHVMLISRVYLVGSSSVQTFGSMLLLGVSVSVFWMRLNIRICRLGKAVLSVDFPPPPSVRMGSIPSVENKKVGEVRL